MGIRIMETADADRLLPLLDTLGWATTADRLASRVDKLLSHPDYQAWVAGGEGPIGLATGQLNWMLQVDEPVAELTSLAVLPEAAGKGVGSALIGAFESWAAASGAARLKLTSGDHRSEAHAFYERRGYQRSGLRFHRTLPGPIAARDRQQ